MSEVSRFRKILSKSPLPLASLQKSDGEWAQSCEESLRLLTDAHFPGSGATSTAVTLQSGRSILYVPADLVDNNRILWALNTFKPYKSAGPDGIIPAELQHAADIIIPWLKGIFTASLKLGYIPLKWRETKVVFIPKAGKNSHCTPNDFRPISLSSFLLKTLERLIDYHIRNNINKAALSQSQHAYMKGKSTETALHNLVRVIEGSLNAKEYALAAFLDIEGAFNNILPGAVTAALTGLKVEGLLVHWIDNLLRKRVINASLGGCSIKRFVSRGTPQGGVLSPLLWILVVNNLLLKLERTGCKVVAYADDVAIVATGIFTSTVRDSVQKALVKLENWAADSGLRVNPRKTDLVLFTRRYKVPPLGKVVLAGIPLELSKEVKYLGLILDSKLNWKSNILERVRKAMVALYSCKNAIGRNWGLNPRVVHWLYTAVVRPILLYGSVVWWPAVEKATNTNLLKKVQRAAALVISGALRTTSTEALEVLLNLMPLDLRVKEVARISAIRLDATGQWSRLSFGHSHIVNSLSLPTRRIDYINPSLKFERGFSACIPSRADWHKKETPWKEGIHFYTDGSKFNGQVGGGVYSTPLNVEISFRLPDHCSVFQAEVLAIREVALWLNKNVISGIRVYIFTDSQAAIKALMATTCNSRVVRECLSSLNEISETFNVSLVWVPGHRDIQGNCKADELARLGTTLDIHPDKELVGAPLASCVWLIRQNSYLAWNQRWEKGRESITARSLCPVVDKGITNALLSLGRDQIRTLVGVLTGHCLIGRHARRLKVSHNDLCKSCFDEEEEESIGHLLCSCPALARARHRYLGAYTFQDLSCVRGFTVRNLLSFVRSSKWFVMSEP